jgi:predicted DNA-binding transcriptional regulator YafY
MIQTSARLLLDDAEAVAVAVGLRTAATGSIAGIEETSVRALAKLEQVLPSRLRRRVSALGDATTSFVSGGPEIDPELLAGIAGACRDATRVHFSYTAKDDRVTQRHTEPCAVVHTGYRWYLVAFDLDRDDWRTFRIDRIRGRLRPGERGRRRTVPGGDPAAFVKRQLRSSGESGAPVGQIRIEAPPETLRRRIPERYATIEPVGDGASLVTTRGPRSPYFLVWMSLLDEPIHVIGPPQLIEAARSAAARLSEAVVDADRRDL